MVSWRFVLACCRCSRPAASDSSWRGVRFELMARWLMLIGAVLIGLGALLHFAPGALQWFGRLPGDIRIETGHGRILVPIMSLLLVSLVLTLLVNLFRR